MKKSTEHCDVVVAIDWILSPVVHLILPLGAVQDSDIHRFHILIYAKVNSLPISGGDQLSNYPPIFSR
jgi:hypothetical protein